MSAPSRPRLTAVQRITILALVLLAVGVLLVASAAAARSAAATGGAATSSQVLPLVGHQTGNATSVRAGPSPGER